MAKKMSKAVVGAVVAGVLVTGTGLGIGDVDAASKDKTAQLAKKEAKASEKAKKEAAKVSEKAKKEADKKKAAEEKAKAEAAKKAASEAKKKAEAAKKEASKKAAEAKKKAEALKKEADKKKAEALKKKIAEEKAKAEEAKKKAAEAKKKAEEAAKKASDLKKWEAGRGTLIKSINEVRSEGRAALDSLESIEAGLPDEVSNPNAEVFAVLRASIEETKIEIAALDKSLGALKVKAEKVKALGSFDPIRGELAVVIESIVDLNDTIGGFETDLEALVASEAGEDEFSDDDVIGDEDESSDEVVIDEDEVIVDEDEIEDEDQVEDEDESGDIDDSDEDTGDEVEEVETV